MEERSEAASGAQVTPCWWFLVFTDDVDVINIFRTCRDKNPAPLRGVLKLSFSSTFRDSYGIMCGAEEQSSWRVNRNSCEHTARKELCVGVEIQVPRAEQQNSRILKAFI